VPICDPDFQPVSVNVSCLWLAYIVGALSILKEQATWDTTDPDEMLLAIQRANNLIDIFGQAVNDGACSEFNVPFACSFDFVTAAGGWIIEPDFGFGTYISGTGFKSVHVSGVSNQVLTISFYFPTPTTIQHVHWRYESQTDGSGANNFVGLYTKKAGSYTLQQSETLHFGTQFVDWTGEVVDVDAVHIQMNSGDADPDKTFTIENAIIDGLSAPDYDCSSA